MPRKKIIDPKSRKFSLDVTGDNKEILDDLTSNYMLKYGPMINKIIGTFCRMPKNIKNVIEKTCLTEYKRIATELEHTTEEFHRKPLQQDLESYHEILKLINGGTYEITKEEEQQSSMTKIMLFDGYLIIPKEWIVVNPEQAKNSRYAIVLECRNSEKYSVPHFIYLTNSPYEKQYTNSFKENFYSLCRNAWPKFSKIEELNKKNQLISDPDNQGQYLNLSEYLASPIIGLFNIQEQGDNNCEDLPYGAMIVRTNVKNK